MDYNDTIAAVITGAGPSAVSIIRISGPRAFLVLEKIFKSGIDYNNVASHTVHYGHIINEAGETADEVLVSVMKAPRTYTAEDVAEINCHGGTKTTENCLRLAYKNGARPAEPGEFTKRAFLNGRIDLSQAEAVSDLIYSKTEQAKNASLRQLSGSLKNAVGEIREEILKTLAHIEASIDFPEDGLDTADRGSIENTLLKISGRIDGLLCGADYGRAAVYGIETVIAGKPNVGKSSLFNAICMEDRAIVTDIPGTTRDILNESVDIGGLYLNIADTAGIREHAGYIERLGSEKAKERMDRAELVLWVTDSSRPVDGEDISVAEMIRGVRVINVINKSDLPLAADINYITQLTGGASVRVSAKKREGFGTLFDEIKKMFVNEKISGGREPAVYKERHIHCLNRAKEAADNVIRALKEGYGEDFLSIDLRECYLVLGEITGETTSDDIIDKIFSEFCLGK